MAAEGEVIMQLIVDDLVFPVGRIMTKEDFKIPGGYPIGGLFKVSGLFKAAPTPIFNTDKGNPVVSLFEVSIFIEQQVKPYFSL